MAYIETTNQGNPNTLAEAWPVEITDGTNVLGTSAHPLEVAGTVTATNPSVSATGAAVPADATMVGASNPSGDLEPLNVDASGYLEVNVKAGSSGNSAASATGSAVPADADYIGYDNGSGNLTGVSSSTPLPVTDSAAETSLATLAGAVSASKVQVAGTVTAEIEGQAGATLDGAAGSPSTQCVTVQGNSSGTAIPTTDSGLGPVAPGNAAANSNLIGGIFNSTPPAPTTGQQTAIQQDSKGSAYVNTEGRKATYVVTLQAQAIATGINLTLQGSATKIIRITRLTFSGLATTAGGSIVSWGITTAAFTGGTTASANFNQGTLDSSNPAATAVPLYYTAAPTGGGAPINVETFEYPFELAASLNYVVRLTFGDRAAQCPTLRGTTQFIYLSIPTAAAGGKYTVAIEWTEE